VRLTSGYQGAASKGSAKHRAVKTCTRFHREAGRCWLVEAWVDDAEVVTLRQISSQLMQLLTAWKQAN
jgi:hypothetical protein